MSLCGDLFISRRIPVDILGGKLTAIQKLLKTHECNFANLEVPVLKKNEGYPELFPGGSYGMASPCCLRDLKEVGFNLFNAANNHAMDYGHNGLLRTLDYLEDVDIPAAGIGRNLSEASSPAFFECEHGRVSLISVTSSFHDSYAAGPQNQDMIGRPGVAPLRHRAVYEVTPDDYDNLVRIAAETGINAYRNAGVKLGYVADSEYFKFGTFEFKKGDKNVCHTFPHPADLERTLRVVRDAKIQSDLVIVSIHSHQVNTLEPQKNPEFVDMFARRCIEEGADIIVCHGPHSMRGVEKFRKGIIFHGLGNMIFQIDQQEVVPEEFYEKYGTTRQDCNGVGTINSIRSNNNTRGFITGSKAWRSVIYSLDCKNNQFVISAYPIEISKQTGLPSLSSDVSILHNLNELSCDYGISFSIEGTVGKLLVER